MSRCFPYPPPGYEKKARSDHVNLLAKVVLNKLVQQEKGEKKHKKEKRNKEKTEGKERKDKDRSKDKQKEKKHQKGKHKDKKKKKDKDKGGNRTSDDSTENSIQFQHGDRNEGSCKAEETSTKLIDELDHQIKHGGNVITNRGVDNFNCPILRSFDGSGAKALRVIKRAASNKVILSSTDILTRGITKIAVCNFSNSIQSHAEVLESANAAEKERIKVSKLVSDLTHLEQRETGGKKRPVGNSTLTIQQSTNGPQVATAMEKENCKQNKFLQSPNGTLQKSFNGMVQSTQSTSPFAPGKIDGIGLAKTTKERGDVKKILQDHIFVEQRAADDGVDQLVVKNLYRRIEGKQKNREEGAYGKNEKPTDRNWNHNKKEKHKARVEGKGTKQAKTREKCEQINGGYKRIRDICEKDQIHNANLAPSDSQRDQKRNSNHTENKKRKILEINGFYENSLLPNKLQRKTPSSDNVENETTVNHSNNFSSANQDHDEVIESADVMLKERKMVNKASDLTHLGKRGNGCKKQPVNNSTITIQQRSDGPYFASEVEKEKCKENKVVQNPNNTVQRSFNGVQSAESISIIAPRKVGIGLTKTTEERGDIKKVSSDHICVQKRVNDGISQFLEKDADRRIQGKEKDMHGEAYGKNEKNSDRDLDEKKKDKDNKDIIQDTGKELTETREKCDEIHKECDEIRDISKVDQIHNPNPELLDFWRDQRRNSNNDQNKSKEIVTNGVFHENGSSPNKFQRATPSHLVANDRIVDASDDAHSSMMNDEKNNIKAQKTLLGIKERIVSNMSVTQSSSDSSRHPVDIDNAKSKACQKPPHPDSKYLCEIYSVPKMYDLPVFDDQEWLFSSYHLQSKPKHGATEISHVWAKALRIGAEDVLALPYVIPL